MNDLVFLSKKKNIVTSHVIISEGMHVTQDSSLKLIKKHKSDIETFGRLRFQIVPFQTKGGVQNRKEYLLTRDQAVFLIMLMRNNPKTIEFKKNLVAQFLNMEGWIKNRLSSSVENMVMNDAIESFYRDKENPIKAYRYSNNAWLCNFAVTGIGKFPRDEMNNTQLEILRKVMIENAKLILFGEPYKKRKTILREFALEQLAKLTPCPRKTPIQHHDTGGQ